MQSIADIRALLESRGIHPKHRFGQNFLHDQNQIRKLIEAAKVKPGDLVLEIGPGTGALTEALLDAGARIIACEIDRDLAALLDERFGDRITLIVGDCLEKGRVLNREIANAIRDFPSPRLGESPLETRPSPGGRGSDFMLAANLPYNIASPLIIALLLDHPNCVGQFVTIQKEVADRLLAQPGTKDYGPLGIITQAFAQVKRISVVPPSCFWPQPKVTSAMVSIVPSGLGERDLRASPDLFASSDSRHAFARFVTDLFTKRRKQLGTILGRETTLPEGITPDLRPDALTIHQLIMLWSQT